ncbi:CCA tRNA nucleotidyltransferase [Paracoccaceae bacterium GXU_MW_L88]
MSEPLLGDTGAARVMTLLEEAGYQAFLVGGAVRNLLLGAPRSDLDITTDARPETVMDLAETAGIRALPTGIDHGTVTLLIDKTPYEITTFRRDVETDGRRAVVAFSDSIAEDAARRDFTMNALYMDRTGAVHDPTGQGRDDLAARRVRFIGAAEERIREDYLRILRFFRFTAWYGEAIDPEGLAASAALADGLGQLSAERIGAEMRKLLDAPDPAPIVASMEASGVLAHLLLGAQTQALAPLVHIEDLPPAWPRRLAVLGGDRSRLKLSNAEEKQITQIIDAAGMGAAEAAWRYGPEIAKDGALVRAACLMEPLNPDTDREIARGAAAEFPVKAADLMPDYQGKSLGDALKMLEAAWLESGMTAQKDALLRSLRRAPPAGD